MTSNQIPLAGYADPLSGRPGDTIAFMVSAAGGATFSARLVRVVCADPNPEGPGLIEQDVASSFEGTYPSRTQPFFPGSCAVIDSSMPIGPGQSFTLAANIWPTLPGSKDQVVLSYRGVRLYIDASGAAAAAAGTTRVSTRVRLDRWRWSRVWLSYDASAAMLEVGQRAAGADGDAARIVSSSNVEPWVAPASGAFIIAAAQDEGARPNEFTAHFNGKIEAPSVYAGAAESEPSLQARWHFERAMRSTHIECPVNRALDGQLVNVPARAMTGSTWDGSEMCWRHAPEHYGAIHFHDDDVYDFGWAADFSFTIPESLPSGVYAARISCNGHEDAMPFFVCPPADKRRARLCVLVSTFTYAIYGNHARPDFDPSWKARIDEWHAYPFNPAEHREYGLSTYNYHADGSGICHASHRRPLFNLRPGYLTFGTGTGSGLRHFQADSHLIAWLEHQGIEYELVTDRQLHDEGVSAIAGYSALTTGSHPEYHTRETLDAIEAYRDQGGNLMYLGGNGFYWRIALHDEDAGVLEIRRGEGGIRAWASEPGEYYNAFDGAYGGLWRRNGRPPQTIAGLGFSSQGTFEGSYYRRKIDATHPVAGWIFEGIDDERLGDFGLSGGGAAGFELDRHDVRLGSPGNAVVLASSEGHSKNFMLVPEEQLTHITTLPGDPPATLIRADMIYYETPSGGMVFSTGSITFCGSLPYNDFDNNISRLLRNVVERFTR